MSARRCPFHSSSLALSLTLSPLPPLSYGRNLAIYLSEWDKKLGRARTLQFEIVEIAQLFSIRASPSPSHEDDRRVGRVQWLDKAAVPWAHRAFRRIHKKSDRALRGLQPIWGGFSPHGVGRLGCSSTAGAHGVS